MKQPRLRINPGPSPPGSGSVLIGDLGADLLSRLSATTTDLLTPILRISVLQEEGPEKITVPDVAGQYRVTRDEIEFIPYFPFERGVKYRATFDPRSIRDLKSPQTAMLEFSFSVERSAAPTEVTAIFPSNDLLPENLLQFYVCFSNSMQRGGAEKQIALLDTDGSIVSDALYRVPVELWDRSMTRLTVLLDPGRLKRWVGPNVALGPPMKAGHEYTLEISSGIIDLHGRPLRESFRKKFRVEDPIRQHIAVEEWGIVPPLMGSSEPFLLTFPAPLDWALLLRTIRIESTDGVPIAGRVAIDNCERTWSLTPASPWAAATYHVRVSSGLEDVCGNGVIAPFERPIRSASDLIRESGEHSFSFCPI